jgi:iron(III) transport system substrate-binding protein
MAITRTTLIGCAAILSGGAASAQELNLICSADQAICERLVQEFEASHDIDMNMVRLSSGESYAKIRAEALTCPLPDPSN